eukprot:4462199-Prorocentrum_lima.AAC.1
MSRTPSVRHSPRHPRPVRREAENGRDESDRSRSTSPSLRAGHLGPRHPMLNDEIGHGIAGSIALTQGYEPNGPELEL